IPRRWTFREATRLESLHLGGGDDFWQLTTRLLTTLTPNKAGGEIPYNSALLDRADCFSVVANAQQQNGKRLR
ncbi:unnamed protein product, partial [Brassica oleracea]